MWNVKDVQHDINGVNLLLLFIFCTVLKEISLERPKILIDDSLFNLFTLFHS